jgi:molybdopterin converting factor subunit 1
VGGAAVSAAGETGEMRVSVLLFAMLRELAGSRSVELRLRPGATVADALGALGEIDALRDALARMRVQMAVNRDYATPETVLGAGDELALIPPVSGGGGERVHVRVSAEPLSLDRVGCLVADPCAGAVVIFQGVTRTVQRLEYEAYVEMAEERLQRVAAECARAHELCAIAIEHRVGSVALGEPSVIVAASAAHRAGAFAAAREAIDRVKAEAPIWKREHERDGTARWVS